MRMRMEENGKQIIFRAFRHVTSHHVTKRKSIQKNLRINIEHKIQNGKKMKKKRERRNRTIEQHLTAGFSLLPFECNSIKYLYVHCTYIDQVICSKVMPTISRIYCSFQLKMTTTTTTIIHN